MPHAQRFDWDAVSPQPVPFSGRTPMARHASATGARFAVHTWGQKVSAYLQLLQAAGPITDQDAAGVLQCGVSSINSIRDSLGDRIVAVDHEFKHWENGRTTTRTRWGLVSR